jgi:hypothetical protein
MRAVEVTGVVDGQGNLYIHEPVPLMAQGNVRVIILYPEQIEDLGQEADGASQDIDDTSVENIRDSLRRALKQSISGQRIPLSQMWEEVDAE